MSQSIRLTYCGIEAEGRTVREAKAAAARELTALVEDTRKGVYLFQVGRIHTVIWRDAYGWTYRLLDAAENGDMLTGWQHGITHEPNQYENLRRAVSHTAQVAWTPDVPDDTAFIADAIPPAIKEPDRSRLASELSAYFAWQRRYKAARDKGFDDRDARDIAGGLHG